jgi:hypothetical protein
MSFKSTLCALVRVRTRNFMAMVLVLVCECERERLSDGVNECELRMAASHHTLHLGEGEQTLGRHRKADTIANGNHKRSASDRNVE